MSSESLHDALSAYLQDHGLKRTAQREVILEAFLTSVGHVSSEDLYDSIRKSHPRIGYTTVYRAMKLLVDAGLAQVRHFEDGIARYEQVGEHHDHLVCMLCGKIVEFECDMIEDRQTEIAESHGFVLKRHRHELYGHCPECQKQQESTPS